MDLLLATASREYPITGYLTESESLFARMTTPPSDARKGQINTLILALHTAGIWAKLDGFWMPAAADAQAAALNWCSTSFTLLPVSSPTFTTDRGWAGNGSTSYVNTQYAPASSSLFLLNSASMGVYLNAGTDTANNSTAMGCNGAANIQSAAISPRAVGDILSFRVNQDASSGASATITTRLGLSSISRTGSTALASYRNGVLVETATTASSSRSSASMFLGARNNGAGSPIVPLDNRFAMAFAGGALTGPEMLALHTAGLAYLTAVGAQ